MKKESVISDSGFPSYTFLEHLSNNVPILREIFRNLVQIPLLLISGANKMLSSGNFGIHADRSNIWVIVWPTIFTAIS